MRRTILTLAVTAALAVVCAAQSTDKSASQPRAGTSAATKVVPGTADKAGLPTESTVDSFLKHTFGYDPSITWKVVNIEPSSSPGVAQVTIALQNPQGQQTVHMYVLPGEKQAVVGDLLPFGADPFAPARNELAAKANGPTRGPATSAATVVEFSDLECPSCKAAQPTIDRLLQEAPDAKFIFQNFPLEQVHPWAFLGATYADCVGRQSQPAFWKFIESVYANQEQITAMLPKDAKGGDVMKQAGPPIAKRLQDLATEAGANGQQVATCAAEPATTARVRKSLALGQSLGVTGTPTLYINGRRVGNVNGIPYDALKAMVESAKQGK